MKPKGSESAAIVLLSILSFNPLIELKMTNTAIAPRKLELILRVQFAIRNKILPIIIKLGNTIVNKLCK